MHGVIASRSTLNEYGFLKDIIIVGAYGRLILPAARQAND
jgi:hypothetical protein